MDVSKSVGGWVWVMNWTFNGCSVGPGRPSCVHTRIDHAAPCQIKGTDIKDVHMYSRVVYRIPCKNCSRSYVSTYVGQSKITGNMSKGASVSTIDYLYHFTFWCSLIIVCLVLQCRINNCMDNLIASYLWMATLVVNYLCGLLVQFHATCTTSLFSLLIHSQLECT